MFIYIVNSNPRGNISVDHGSNINGLSSDWTMACFVTKCTASCNFHHFDLFGKRRHTGIYIVTLQWNQIESVVSNYHPIYLLKFQLLLAAIFSTIYSLVMLVVLIGLLIEGIESQLCSVTTVFFCFVAGVFLVTAILHPMVCCIPILGAIVFWSSSL